MDDYTVLPLVQLWKAFGSSGPDVCKDVEEVAKTAYEMVVGERLSFEEAYGEFRPDFSNWAPKTSLESYASDSVFRIMARLLGDKCLKRSQNARWDSGSWQKRFPHVTLQHCLRRMEKHQDEYLK